MSDCRHGIIQKMDAISAGKCPVCLAYSHETLMIAMRRIRSLADKNVPKYAQQIAIDAIARVEAAHFDAISPAIRGGE